MCHKVFEQFICHHTSPDPIMEFPCDSLKSLIAFSNAGSPLPADQAEVLLEASRRQSTRELRAPHRLCGLECEHLARLVEEGKGKGRAHLERRVG